MSYDYASLVRYYQSQSSGKDFIDFSCKINSNEKQYLGVKIPIIKQTAKEIAKTNPNIILDYPFHQYFEIDLTKFLVVVYQKATTSEKIKQLEAFLPFLDNWALVDSTCCAFKVKKADYAPLFQFAKQCIASKKEYITRFGVILCLSNLVCDEYIDAVLNLLKEISYGPYYIDMGVAWLLCDCYIYYFEKTHDFLFNHEYVPHSVIKKTIQKCIDSFRISNETKEMLKNKRKSFS